jgi:phosphoglycolate phosphatase-like HAD superfamily hydrolase
VNQLAIFDIDGTLTDTAGVDDDCYRETIAEALGVAPSAIDWSGAAHVTDSEIFRWLSQVHGRDEPDERVMARARARFVERLSVQLSAAPTRFSSIRGAGTMLRDLPQRDWCVAFATGGWGPSALLKLRVAEITLDEAVFACADDARTRADIVRLARDRAESFYERHFDRVVSVGDGVWDVQTAAALRLPFVGIGKGAHAERLRTAGAQIVVSDYADLDEFRNALDVAAPPSIAEGAAVMPPTNVL